MIGGGGGCAEAESTRERSPNAAPCTCCLAHALIVQNPFIRGGETVGPAQVMVLQNQTSWELLNNDYQNLGQTLE